MTSIPIIVYKIQLYVVLLPATPHMRFHMHMHVYMSLTEKMNESEMLSMLGSPSWA